MHRALIILSLALTSLAFAGVVDSPLPVLSAGQTTYHLFTVPSTIASGGIETFFGCTSLEETATIQVGVELFGPAGGAPGNDAAATSLSVAASGTVLFGSAAVGLFPDSNPGIPFLSKGSARILATESRGIICTAFLADTGSDPPTSMVHLNIVKKTKQKGD